MRRKLSGILLALVVGIIVVFGLRTPTVSDFPHGYSSYTSYERAARNWIEDRRIFQTTDHDAELAANAPIEWRPAGLPAAGVLLVHGLGDSPFSFVDLGKELALQGFLVRAMLLPGHGTTPSDMIGVGEGEWHLAVREQIDFLREETPDVFLGGFSTGANLVVTEAMADQDIRGLLLFSPAFRSRFALDRLAPAASTIMTWWERPSPDTPQQTMLQYLNVPMDALAAFYHSSVHARDAVEENNFARPVFMVVSEQDAAVNVEFAAEVFNRSFSHPGSRLVWYGRNPPLDDSRMVIRPDALPEERISSFSHMSLLFSPENDLYGRNGSMRICNNGGSPEAVEACRKAETIWYSEWGKAEEGKITGHLTFNPYFTWQSEVMSAVLRAGLRSTDR